MIARTKPHKSYSRMTTEELREATHEYDREQLGLPGKPLTAVQRGTFRTTAKRSRRPARKGDEAGK